MIGHTTGTPRIGLHGRACNLSGAIEDVRGQARPIVALPPPG
jgi:hypothetical protein